MASFSFSTSSFAVISVTLFLAVPIWSYPLDNICKESKDPNFCYNLLQPRANANLQEIDEFVIDATLDSASKTSSKIQSLLGTTNDPNLKVVYLLCSNYYSAAVSALNAAKEKLKSGEYSDVKSAADTVSRDAASCQQTFSLAPSQPIAIAGDNNEFGLLSNVFLVASNKL